MSVWDWLLIADLVYLVLIFVGGPILLSYIQEPRSSGDTKERSED